MLRSIGWTVFKKRYISCTAFDMSTAWKLSPYFNPPQIPAAMAYTFFKTEEYSMPMTSLEVLVLMYSLAKQSLAKARAFSVSEHPTVR